MLLQLKIFFFFFYSRLAGFELHFGLLIDGVERVADIIEDVNDFAVDVVEV